MDFMCRLNERYTLLTDARIDARSGDLISSRIGLSTRLAGAWELIYAITFRDQAQRESDVEFKIALRLLAL